MINFLKFVVFTTILLFGTEFTQSTSVYLFYRSGSQLHFIEGPIQSTGEIIWESDITVPNTYLSFGPTAIIYNNLIYVFHQGGGNDGQLWYNKYNPSTGTWAGDTQVNLYYTGVTPGGVGAVVYNGIIYVFYVNGVGSLWSISSADGVNFQTPVQLTGSNTASYTPNVINFNGVLYMSYNYNGFTNRMIYFQPTWTQPVQIDGLEITGGPQAVTANGILYLFRQGPNADGQLWYMSSLSTPNIDTQISSLWKPIAPDSGPAPVVIGNYIYSFYASPNGLVYYSAITLNGGPGPVDQVYPIPNAAGQPSVVLY